MKNDFRQLHDSVTEMRNAAAEIREEIDKTLKLFGWSDWEPHTVGIIPRRVNRRWYFKATLCIVKKKCGAYQVAGNTSMVMILTY